MAKLPGELGGYIRPDFSDESMRNTALASFYYKAKDKNISNEIDGYMEFATVDKAPVLEKRKIKQDKLVLATLSDGKVLSVDTNGILTKEFPK